MRKLAAHVFSAWLLICFGFSFAGASGPGLVGHGGPVRALALLDERTLVSGGFDSAIIVWDTQTGTAIRVLRFHDTTVTALAKLADGCFASGGEDARIAVWCGDSSSPQRVLSGHSGPVSALAMSPDGRWLASASWDRTVRLWPLNDSSGASRQVSEHGAPVNGVAFTADGTAIVSGAYDGTLRLGYIEASRAQPQVQLLSAINGLAVAPGGEVAVSCADGKVRLFDAKLAPTGEIELPDGPLTAVAVSPDGRQIATAGLRTPVTLIDRNDAKRITTQILGPGLPIWVLSFSNDGSEVFTGGADRAVRRWNTATGKPIGASNAPVAEVDPGAGGERGAQVFRACRACHGLGPEDGNRAGPTLHGVFGRRIASAPGYVYSEALRRMDIVWSAETIAELFKVGPNAYTPGTKMPEQRITDPADREALIEWLERTSRPQQ